MIDISEYIEKLEDLKNHWVPQMVAFVATKTEVQAYRIKTLIGKKAPALYMQMCGRALRPCPDPPIRLYGYLNGKKVPSASRTVYNQFDGCRLDELMAAAELRNRKDCDDLIETIQIHKHCFI